MLLFLTGTDHMSAMQIIHDVKAKGGKISKILLKNPNKNKSETE